MAHLSGGRPQEGAPELNYNYEIILAIANEGYTDNVMDAARAAGAVVMSLPVSAVAGFGMLDHSEEK